MTELDVKNGIRTLASKATPPHDEQAFMDEYYKGTGKSSDVAIGALGLMTLGVPFIRAQKVANTLQTQKNISRYVKENILKNRNPDKVTFANLIEQGFFKNPAKVAAEFEKQIGRLGKGGMGLAGTAWLSKFGPQNIPEHDEQALMDEYYSQKKANGGSIYEAEKSYDYDPALWGPITKGIASILLPQDATDVALMAVPPIKGAKIIDEILKRFKSFKKKPQQRELPLYEKNDPRISKGQEDFRAISDRLNANEASRKAGTGELLSPYDKRGIAAKKVSQGSDEKSLTDDLLRTIVDIVTPD